MGGWEGSAHHLAATFMVPHCPSFGNEAPLIFFSGCKRNCPSLNIREPPSAWSPSIFLHSCFSLFLPFSFSKRTFITPPSHPAAFLPSPLLWKISRYAFDHKVKTWGKGGADLRFFFIKKKVIGGGEGLRAPRKA